LSDSPKNGRDSSHPGIAGANPAEGMNCVSCKCCLLSGKGFCNGLICVCGVCLCVWVRVVCVRVGGCYVCLCVWVRVVCVCCVVCVCVCDVCVCGVCVGVCVVCVWVGV